MKGGSPRSTRTGDRLCFLLPCAIVNLSQIEYTGIWILDQIEDGPPVLFLPWILLRMAITTPKNLRKIPS